MIDLIIEPRRKDLGGFEVGRVLPYAQRRMVGPFVFFDHMGPVEVQAGFGRNVDVRPPPHIGLSTVPYLFDGQITHRDSVGSIQEIHPGEVNWMTAGRGITHSERFEDPSALAGGNLEMIQTWVALPEKNEEQLPTFDNYKPEVLPVFTDKGVWMRLIAGNAYGLKNDVKTHSPLFYVHMVLDAGTTFPLPKEHPERAVYVVKGSIEVAGRTYSPGQMTVFTKGMDDVVKASEHSTIMFLGGEPVGDRFIWWNFVSSRKERIEQAKADWKAGRSEEH